MNQSTYYILSIAITIVGFAFSVGMNYQFIKDLKNAFEEHKKEDKAVAEEVKAIRESLAYAKGLTAGANKSN